MRRRLGFLFMVALVGLLGLAVVSDAASPVVSDEGVATCRTDNAGYCTVAHQLGSQPTSAQVTATFYAGTTPYLMAVAKGGLTSTTLRVRAVYNSGPAVANASIEFNFVVYGEGVTPDPDPDPQPGATCTSPTWTTTSNDNNGGAQDFPPYVIHNNMWNNHAGQGPVGMYTLGACDYNSWHVTATQSPSLVSPGAVRAYPNVHKDYPDTPLSQIKSAKFAATSPRCAGCIYNVAFDVWIGQDFRNELMIWTENWHQTPAGDRLANATIGDHNYQVWKTDSASTPGGIFTYVADPPLTSGTMPLDLFFADLQRRSWIDGEATTWQVDFGVEVVSTNGRPERFDFTDFSIEDTP